MMRLTFFIVAVLSAAVWPTDTVQAEPAADPKALAKAQHMLRRVSAERDELQAEKSRLQATLDKQKSETAGLQKKYDALRSRSENVLNQANEIIAGLRSQLQETSQTLNHTQTEKQQLEDTRVAQAKQIEICSANNAKLVQVNSELLEHYNRKGVWDSMVQREPFTGLKQVEIENLMEEYRAKLDELRVSSKEGTVKER